MSVGDSLQEATSSTKSVFFDCVRGVSAQMVLFGHCLNVCFPAIFMTSSASGLLEARHGFFFIQNLGVLLFFCISGYLVTGSVIRRCGSAFYGMTDFIIDRFARIFTPLVPLLLILFLVEWQFDGRALAYTVLNAGAGDLLLNLLMLFDNPALSFLAGATGENWLRAGAFGSAEQLWTVVIEWWIYVTFGLAAFLYCGRIRPSFWPVTALLVAATVPAYSLYRGNGLVIAWVFGMLGAIYQAELDRIPGVLRSGLILIFSGFCVVTLGANGNDLYDPAVAISLSIALFSAASLARTSARAPSQFTGTIRYLSDVSYSLYLVHLSILYWMFTLFPQLSGSPLAFVAAVTVCNGIAYLFYLLFERRYPDVRRYLARVMGRA